MLRSTVAARRRFDRRYYERFYEDPSRAVDGRAHRERLVRFVLSAMDLLELPVRDVLDLGAGTGAWKRALRELRPGARYRGVEASTHACRRYGWEFGLVEDYAGASADLVVCQGVLQYLEDAVAARAIENLARLARHAIYLEVLTRRDWEEVCDQERTDGQVWLRSGRWYLERLRRHFVPFGGGLFLPHAFADRLYEMEAPSLAAWETGEEPT